MQVLNDMQANIHLRANEFKLLSYLANCAEGFTPAIKTILSATGISDESSIKRARKRLRQMSLLDYNYASDQWGHFYFINWSVIIGYALHDSLLPAGGLARANFKQCDFRYFEGHPFYVPCAPGGVEYLLWIINYYKHLSPFSIDRYSIQNWMEGKRNNE